MVSPLRLTRLPRLALLAWGLAAAALAALAVAVWHYLHLRDGSTAGVGGAGMHMTCR